MKTIEDMKKDGLEPWEVLDLTRSRYNPESKDYLTDDELWYYATLPDEVLIDKIKKVYFENIEIPVVPEEIIEAIDKTSYILDLDFWQFFDDWKKGENLCDSDEIVVNWLNHNKIEDLFLFLLNNSVDL